MTIPSASIHLRTPNFTHTEDSKKTNLSNALTLSHVRHSEPIYRAPTLNLAMPANIFSAGPKLKAFDHMSPVGLNIAQQIKGGKLKEVSQEIIDIRGRVEDFKLFQHGFEFRQLPSRLHDLIRSIRDGKHSEGDMDKLKHEITKLTEKYLDDLGEDVIAVPLGMVSRSSKPRGPSGKADVVGGVKKRKPSVIPHVDFTLERKADVKQVFTAFHSSWDKNFADKIGKSDYELVKMINVWTLQDEVNESNPLFVYDNNTVKDQDVMGVTASRKYKDKFFPAGIIDKKESNKAYWLSNMSIGDSIIFDTGKTLHSSFRIPGQSDLAFRNSTDLRIAFVKKVADGDGVRILDK
ncbi:hypothetical protein [Agarilytica rhodophyticola]|uniref:hypothetical protein n=1 Tax=Agarilytica rhodophyticola TaxID=1737490 RepID=UPI000B343913|nr:hypothetical protein [Agarilytica rhodophyticola]